MHYRIGYSYDGPLQYSSHLEYNQPWLFLFHYFCRRGGGEGKACGWNIPPFGSPQLSQETAVLYPMEQPGLAQMDYENVGTIRTDSFSSPVPSKPPQRRESGPCPFDSLEGLHPNLLKKPCCFSLPLHNFGNYTACVLLTLSFTSLPKHQLCTALKIS